MSSVFENPDRFIHLTPSTDLDISKLVMGKLFKASNTISAIPAKPWVQDLAHEEGLKVELLELKIDEIIEPKSKGFLGALFGN